MSGLPSITPTALADALLEQGMCTLRDLTEAFGAERDEVGLNDFELGLVQRGLVSDRALLEVKGLVSGRPILDDRDPGVRADLLDRVTAKRAGALAIDSRATPAVAMVEDLPANVELVAAATGRPDFEIVLCTASQFRELLEVAYGTGPSERRSSLGSIYELLDEAVRRNASDLHLSVGRPPTLRVAGRLTALYQQVVSADWLEDIMRELAGPELMARWEETGDVDLAVDYGSSRFRVNLGRYRAGMTVAARRLPAAIPSMDDLRLPPAVRNFTTLERGLVLVTGPTGSGKSTTLASLLSHIITNGSGRHLITLEDPIEYLLPQGNAMVHQRELGRDFSSFPQALRQALRQDPDIILVGELRDPETVRTAITAAETGHLVFSTVHTFDAASTIGRMIGQFPEGEQPLVRAQLSAVLRGVLSQTLVPTVNHAGRVGAFEVLVGTPAISNNLRKIDGTTQLRQIIETASRDGMQTMEQDLAALVRAGAVSEEEARFRARDVSAFEARLH